MLLPIAGIVLASCGVTEPDDSAWQSASSYSWPVGPGKRELTFRNEESIDSGHVQTTIDTFDMEATTTSEREFAGLPMYKLDKRQRGGNVFFLPLRDTLIIFDQLPAKRALVAPLEKGNSWICEYDADTIPTWRATIVERYSYRNVEGKIYKNVIEVEYVPLTERDINAGDSWVRFFAKDVGPVQTIKLHNTLSSNPSVPDKSEPIRRTILIDNIEATK